MAEAPVFVDKYYVMEPLEEELLPDGTFLKDGMVVLIDRTESREDVSASSLSPAKLDSARLNNRWCQVSRIEIRGETLSFLATYEDHTVKKRVTQKLFPWLVKIHSISDPLKEQRDAVYNLVYQGLQYQDSVTYSPSTSDLSITERAGQTADKIVGLFEK